ncbi:uncharacterized protein LOC129941727 [Eupeodes corollae]|uniref:uncharacterized protein LOC129941727 n=1 Tax=Eupeodes corollae TaxID=290404 RepID=UPI0024924A8F|nr:uncharacterized protein LOC129941727 [Eupeodes corollae]
MKAQFYCLILLAILAFCNSNPAPLNTDESEARLFIQDAKNKLNTIYEEMRLVGHDLDINPNLMFRYQKLQNVTNSIAELAQQSKKFETSQYKDEELKYILEILTQQADEGILGTWWFEKMLDAVNAVEAIGSRKNIAKFHKKRVNLAYYPDIENIIAYTNNSAELKYYWKELREHNSNLVVRNLITITDVILKAANATGES